MSFEISDARAILSQTPATLQSMLGRLPESWLDQTEGPGTWSAREVVAHLVDLEETDWPVRADIIVRQGTSRPFTPIDRERFRDVLAGVPLDELLEMFAERRARNLHALIGYHLGPERLQLRGVHPDFGEVTLEQLLSTWVVHDLNHIAQIARVMAKRYGSAVGPWRAYLGVLS